MTERERGIDKARKLRALAKDQDGTPEGDRAAEAFAKLAQKWHVTEAELLAAEVTTRRVDRGGPGAWRSLLLTVLATWWDCHATHNMKTGWSSLYGDSAGIDATWYAYEYVIEWLGERCATWRRMYSAWGLAEDDDYFMTAVVSLHKRLRHLKLEQEYDPFAYQEQQAADRVLKDQLAKARGNTALAVDRSDLREEAARRAAAKPTADREDFEHEYVPQAASSAQVLPWPPPPPEERKKPKEPPKVTRSAGQLGHSDLDDLTVLEFRNWRASRP